MCMCVYVRVFLCGCGCGCDVCINIYDICFLSKRLAILSVCRCIFFLHTHTVHIHLLAFSWHTFILPHDGISQKRLNLLHEMTAGPIFENFCLSGILLGHIRCATLCCVSVCRTLLVKMISFSHTYCANTLSGFLCGAHPHFVTTPRPFFGHTHLEFMILRWHLPLSHTYWAKTHTSALPLLQGPLLETLT